MHRVGDTMHFFARNLRTMRTIRGLTQTKLAKMAATRIRLIIALEADKVLPTSALERRLRQALNWAEREDRALEMLNQSAVE